MTELGDKHECLDCGTKFYDLGKTELICPKCGGNQKELAEAEAGKAKTAASAKRAAAKKKKKKKAKKKAKQEETPEEVAPTEGDKEPAEDTDLDDGKMEDKD